MATRTVYVRLLDEGVDVWRPVDAEEVSHGVYRLVGTYDSSIEKREFETGSIVRVEERPLVGGVEGGSIDRGPELVAVEMISD